MTTTIVRVFAAALLLVAVTAPAPGAEGAGPKKLPAAPQGSPVNTYLNINNISTVFWNNGYSDIDIQDLNSGFVFPKGSGKTAVFKSGFLWGGRVAGEVRVGGSAYRTGLQGGRILSPGVPEDPNLDKNRIYRVRPDFRTGDVSAEVRDEGSSADAVRARYLQDWTEWPVVDGAPYEDVNANGTYDSGTDIPGVPGADQTIFFVANDLNSGLTTNLYGPNPMGLELQVTVWAYSQQGPLGNMLFRRYVLINKGTNTIDSMYVTQWTDTDLGDASDDFSGCDTTLSVFYTYNAFETDATYSPLPPPAVGFDFFQGPLVAGAPSDSGIFLGRRVYGKKNLPLTAHYYFARGDANVTDPTQGSYEGTTQFYNFMRGLVGRTGAPFADPGGRVTKFALDGDPVTGEGWVDGEILPAGDRRNGGASGPFTMAPGDTQEVVVAEIAAGAIAGVNRLNAVNLMKFYDNAAQLAYNNFFQVPAPPPPPQVAISALDQEIIFTWGNNADAVAATENSNNGGFAFEGYNIYQLPSAAATRDQATRIATYDQVNGVTIIQDLEFDASAGVLLRVPKQFGTDAGVSRSIRINRDALRGNTPLINGIRYYFAITAYSYNPDPNAVPNNLENPLLIIAVTPQSPNPGVRYEGTPGDTITPVHTALNGASLSDGTVTPLIVDPARLTGQTYEVTFADDGSGGVTWSLRNVSTNRLLLENQTNQSGNADYLLTDGFQVVVQGPPNGMKDWEIPNGARRWTWVGGDGFGLEGFEHAMGNAYEHWFSGSTVTPAQLHNVLIKLAATDAAGNLLNPSDTTASLGYRYLRAATAPPARPEFAPFILNPSAGYAYQEFGRAGAPNIPFAAYDMDRGGQRMAVGHLENNQPGGTVNGRYWPPFSNSGVDNVAAGGPREWWFIYDVPYGTTPDPALTVDILNVTTPMMWMGTPSRRGGDIAFSAGDEFLILANKINSPNDVFTFTAPSVISDPVLAKQDVSKINVFPNPYYGVNSEELNKYQRFVTFNHLPDVAVIRIFNLAGVLVRTIRHEPANGAGSQFERWDLSNESGLPVGSGLYIAHIEMPTLGATKILKLAVVHEQQILDRF